MMMSTLLTERKKTEYTIISHNFRNSEHQNIHVMLSYAKIARSNKQTKQSRCFDLASRIVCFDLAEYNFFETKEEKNGAHNHLSHRKKLRASKYSRHVVLCKKSHVIYHTIHYRCY